VGRPLQSILELRGGLCAGNPHPENSGSLYEFRAEIDFIDIDDAAGVGVRLISAPAKKRGKGKG